MVSERKHKENFGALCSVVERLEALWKRLNAFRAFRERVGSFGRPGRLGIIKPYGMIGMVCMCFIISRNKWERSRAFWSVLKCLGNV